ncbi:hypothetical protein G4T81_002929, partial [Listeria monocytogenes]|nr:hypothetical protein [Listeria monocytogenes]
IKQDENKLSSRNLQKNKLIEARENLKKTHENHYLKESTCPYCGKEDEKLLVLYNELSDTISENESELSKHITEKRTELQQFIENEFSDEINEYISKHQKDIDKYDRLSSLFKVDTTKFEENLKELDLSINLIEETNPFDEVYSSLIGEIKEKLIPVKEDFNNEVLLECEHISNKYFDNEKPNISIEDVHNKKIYLIQSKNRLGKKKMKENETIYVKTKIYRDDVEKKLKNKISEISELRSIYQSCIHNYNSEFLRDVKVPLFVISGRIMQTAPIGLGIEAKIDDRRVEFLSGNVDHDVTNMLSAGQLNGLMISILLAVQKTYLSDKGVKLFMIDDPLQTIDDLSAHSFVDLLTQEFADNQIFISTHELEKTAMFYYKYDQAKISFTRKNLQLEYLNN